MFEGNLQHDAHELLGCLLAYIQDAVKEVNGCHDNKSIHSDPMDASSVTCHSKVKMEDCNDAVSNRIYSTPEKRTTLSNILVRSSPRKERSMMSNNPPHNTENGNCHVKGSPGFKLNSSTPEQSKFTVCTTPKITLTPNGVHVIEDDSTNDYKANRVNGSCKNTLEKDAPKTNGAVQRKRHTSSNKNISVNGVIELLEDETDCIEKMDSLKCNDNKDSDNLDYSLSNGSTINETDCHSVSKKSKNKELNMKSPESDAKNSSKKEASKKKDNSLVNQPSILSMFTKKGNSSVKRLGIRGSAVHVKQENQTESSNTATTLNGVNGQHPSPSAESNTKVQANKELRYVNGNIANGLNNGSMNSSSGKCLGLSPRNLHGNSDTGSKSQRKLFSNGKLSPCSKACFSPVRCSPRRSTPQKVGPKQSCVLASPAKRRLDLNLSESQLKDDALQNGKQAVVMLEKLKNAQAYHR